MFTTSRCLSLLLVGALAVSTFAEEDGKIVGGTKVDISDYPYQVSFQYNGQHFCGGTIVDETHIVTAAHCVVEFNGNTNGLSIVAGQTKLSDSDGQSIPVASMIAHPKYNKDTTDYDAAVLKLASPLTFNSKVQPLGFAADAVSRGDVCAVSGWGTTHRGGGGDLSDDLQATQVTVLRHSVCNALYLFGLTNRMFCAGRFLGGADSCQGDSGGPVNHKNKLVGIVSFGRGCANILSPGVYTSVPAVLDFLYENISS